MISRYDYDGFRVRFAGKKRKSPSIDIGVQEPPFKKHKNIDCADPNPPDDTARAASPPLIIFAAQQKDEGHISDLSNGAPIHDSFNGMDAPPTRRQFRVVLNPDIIQGLEALIPSDVNPFYHRFMDKDCRLKLWDNDSLHSMTASTEPLSDCSSISASAPAMKQLNEDISGDDSMKQTQNMEETTVTDVSIAKQHDDSANGEEVKRGNVEGGGPPPTTTECKDAECNEEAQSIKIDTKSSLNVCDAPMQSEQGCDAEIERTRDGMEEQTQNDKVPDADKTMEDELCRNGDGARCLLADAESPLFAEPITEPPSHPPPPHGVDEWEEEVVEEEEEEDEVEGDGAANNHVIELLSDDTESDEIMTNNDGNEMVNGAEAHKVEDAEVENCEEMERNDKQTEFMRYPPKSPKPVIITIGDVGRLRPETYLNDSLIDFYLNWIYEEILEESQREDVFIFNQFFYTKLDQAIDEKNERLRLRLAKWTKGANIFEKAMIVIPINISLHWSLCVITFPGHSSPICRVKQSFDDSIESLCREEILSMISSKVIGEPDWVRPLERDCRVEAISNHRTKILHFDSMRGCHPSFEIFDKLRIYLDDEWKRKCPEIPRPFTMSTFPGISLGVPQQCNSADCGVFLLHFAELFCLNPFYDAGRCLTRDDWFSQDVVTQKRRKIKELCISLRRKQGKKDLDVDRILDRLRITVESQSGANSFPSISYSAYNGGVAGDHFHGSLDVNGYGPLNGYHDDAEMETDSDDDERLQRFEDRLWDTDSNDLKDKLSVKCSRNTVLMQWIKEILTEIEEEHKAMAIRRRLNNPPLYQTN